MKALTKILPLTLAASAASITPFITSCGKSYECVAEWNYRDGVYMYTTGRHNPKKIELPTTDETPAYAEGTKLYFTKASENPMMFAEDVVQKMSYYQIKPIDPESVIPMIPLTVRVSIENLYYDKTPVDVYVPGQATKYQTGLGYVTFDLSFTGIMGTIIYDDDDEPIGVRFDTYIETNVEMENVGFYLYYRWEGAQKPFEHWWDVEQALIHPKTTEPFYELIQPEPWSISVETKLPALQKQYKYVITDEDVNQPLVTYKPLLRALFAAEVANSISPDYCYYMNDVSVITPTL